MSTTACPVAPTSSPSADSPHRQQTAQTANGRDTRGRFTKGNRGGPGNPFARRLAHFRSLLLDCVTNDDIRQIMQKLLELARGGDLAAIKLLLTYAVGQPTPCAEPDRMDLDEWQLREAMPTLSQMCRDSQFKVSKDIASSVLRRLEQRENEAYYEDLEYEKWRREQKTKSAAPSANGSNGHPAASNNDQPPASRLRSIMEKLDAEETLQSWMPSDLPFSPRDLLPLPALEQRPPVELQPRRKSQRDSKHTKID